MKKIKKIFITQILILIILVTTSNATMFKKENSSKLMTTVGTNQTSFKVIFSGNPKVSNEDRVNAYISSNCSAAINVTGLTMQNNIEYVTYVVQNTSADLSAKFDVETVNSNNEYFKIDVDMPKDVLTKGEAVTVTVKIELIKQPIKEIEKTLIGIKLKATPVQPTENNNSYPTNNNQKSNKDDYNEKDETPKTGIWEFREIFGR